MLTTSKAPEKQAKQPKQRPETALLHEAVRNEFKRMRAIKKGKAPLYSQEFVIQEVAKKYFKSPKTIENIVFNRV